MIFPFMSFSFIPYYFLPTATISLFLPKPAHIFLIALSAAYFLFGAVPSFVFLLHWHVPALPNIYPSFFPARKSLIQSCPFPIDLFSPASTYLFSFLVFVLLLPIESLPDIASV